MNDNVYLFLISGGLFLSIMCFLVGRMSVIKAEAKAEAERFVRLETKMDGIKTTLDNIVNNTDESFRWVHERLDHHLRNEHDIQVPSRD